jgi:hypothetical protein
VEIKDLVLPEMIEKGIIADFEAHYLYQLENYVDDVQMKNEANAILLQLTSEIEKDMVLERTIIGYQTFGNKVHQKMLSEILKHCSVASRSEEQ